MDKTGEETERWMVQSIRYFRARGFFAAQAALTDEEIAQKARAWYGDEFITPVEPQKADMALLALDKTRVWWEELKYVYPGEERFVELLQGWAAISRGAFTPTEISERWVGEEGPVEVTFVFRGQPHRLTQNEARIKYIDMALIRPVNDLIYESGYQLEVLDDWGMPDYVLALTADERAMLQRERGWHFLGLWRSEQPR